MGSRGFEGGLGRRRNRWWAADRAARGGPYDEDVGWISEDGYDGMSDPDDGYDGEVVPMGLGLDPIFSDLSAPTNFERVVYEKLVSPYRTG